MYKEFPNICYECGIPLDQESLTKEHVPPKCFFPKSDKASLITVPSCVEHNGGKSNDDEYLLQMISIQIQANEKGQNIAQEKAIRSMLRNKKRTKEFANNANIVYVDENKNGQLRPTFAFKFDADKYNNSISSICKGLYYYEFHKVFNGEVRIYNEFEVSLDNDSVDRNQEYEKYRGFIKEYFSNIEKKGKNQSIFYYQIVKPAKGLGFSLAIRLCFYGGIGILAFLKEKKEFKLNAITSALAKL